MTRKFGFLFGLSMSVLFLNAAGVQAEALTPKETYLKYRAALPAAQKIEDVSSFMCKRVNEEIKGTPADMKPMMFGFIKETAPKTVQILSEEVKGDNATLVLTGKSEPEVQNGNKVKEDTKGKVTFLKEDGVWKIDKESWDSKVKVGGD